jgi:hypothetical protein
VLIHSLLSEVKGRLAEDGGLALLSPSNFKLSQNLPKFFGLVRRASPGVVHAYVQH